MILMILMILMIMMIIMIMMIMMIIFRTSSRTKTKTDLEEFRGELENNGVHIPGLIFCNCEVKFNYYIYTTALQPTIVFHIHPSVRKARI